MRITWVILLIGALIGCAVAALFAYLSWQMQPVPTVVNVGVLSAVLLALAAAVFMAHRGGLRKEAGIALAVMCAILLQVQLLFHIAGERQLTLAQDMAVAVREYGLANFAKLDTSGDGLVSEAELAAAAAAEGVVAKDKAVLDHMTRNITEIGHAIDTRPSVIPTSSNYGISRADLEKYPEKVGVPPGK